MRCTNCETEIPAGEKFCPQCGVPVGTVEKCPHCGAALLPGERFCGECGREVTTDPGAEFGLPSTAAPDGKQRPWWVWVVIGLIGLILIGCVAICGVVAIPVLLATPTPTLTPFPTVTPTPTPVPTPSIRAGTLLLEEDFTSPGDVWGISKEEDIEYKLDGAKYSIEVNKENWIAWNTLEEDLDDFIIQFETTLVDGEMFNASGLFFRYQDKDNFYSVELNGNAKYTIGKEIDGEWSDIVDWTASAAISALGEVNVVRLVVYGNTFALYINDQFVDEFTDTTFLSGDVALHVTAYDTPPVRATFDNLQIWEIEPR